ncbi:glioma pathogenesis-related protein 1-like isoform X2 [Lissotriton helveticus]
MDTMTWDPALAITAMEWAKNCTFSHNAYLDHSEMAHPTLSTVGENIWMGKAGTPLSFTAEFAAEETFYVYRSNTCMDRCGQYTQVVWDDTYKVGCAANFCPRITNFESGSDMMIVVCNYGPSGNYNRKPYEAGRPCSKCAPDDECVDNLCRNADRDAVVQYRDWIPSWAVENGKASRVASKPCCSLNHLLPLVILLLM